MWLKRNIKIQVPISNDFVDSKPEVGVWGLFFFHVLFRYNWFFFLINKNCLRLWSSHLLHMIWPISSQEFLWCQTWQLQFCMLVQRVRSKKKNLVTSQKWNVTLFAKRLGSMVRRRRNVLEHSTVEALNVFLGAVCTRRIPNHDLSLLI